MVEPLKPSEARRLIQQILKHGDVTYSQPHAIERLQARAMDTGDCINILRGGTVREGEYENGSWRYRVETPRMVVVVTFIDENELMIVTAWREKQ